LDDLPPVTVITLIESMGEQLVVHGIAHDNGEITEVRVNGRQAEIGSRSAGVVDWKLSLEKPRDGRVTASASDDAGNRELTKHLVRIGL
jgi:hypothetical protein